MSTTFIKIPNSIVGNLKGHRCTVYLYLLYLCTVQQSDSVKVKQETIAQKLGISFKESVNVTLRYLQSNGYITMEHNFNPVTGRQACNTITVRNFDPQNNYFLLPSEYIFVEMPSVATELLLTLYMLAFNDPFCFPSFTQISKTAKMGASSIVKAYTVLEEKGIIKVDWKKWSVKVQEIIETGVEFCKQWEDRQLKDEDNKKCKKNIPDSNLKWYSMSMFKYYMDEKNRIKDDEKKDDIQSKIGEISSGSSKCWHWKMIKGWIEYYWNYDFYYDLDYQNNIWPFEPELDEFEYEKDYEKRMIVERVTIEKLDSYDFIIRRWSVEP